MAPLPPDEPARLAELDRYAILATPPEQVFDRITKLASRIFRCPVALLSFVAAKQQWFKSCIGVDFTEGPRSDSFCSWAILGKRPLVVPDARTDARFAANPLVTGTVGIRFYAGAPLLSDQGFNLGTLCIIDTEPRPRGLTDGEIESLIDLADLAMHALNARLVVQESQETKDLLHTTLMSIGDGVIVADHQSRITFLNPVAADLTGWALTDAVTRPVQEVFSIVDEVSREITNSPMQRALSEGRVVNFANHNILFTKDGRELAVDDSAAPIFRGSAIVGGVLIFRDVTKRRMAERLLEHSESQFRSTFANAPLGLVLTQLDGRFIESNEAHRRISGYADEELTSLHFSSLTHPLEVENNLKLFRQLTAGEIDSYVLEKRIITKVGAIRWVRVHGTLLRDASGTATKVIGIVEDITGRKDAEQRFRFLAESIPQMVWTATAEGLLDYVSRQGSEYFGTSPEALLGSKWLQWVHPDDQAKAVERWSASLQSGEDYDTEFRLKRGRDASWRLHLARALPLKADDGKVIQWFGTCTDIEGQHQATRQIEEDRRRWRDLLLEAPAAIALLRGPEHRFEWTNAGYTQLVGQPGEALRGKTVSEALPEIQAQIYSKLLDTVYRTGEPFAGHESPLRLNHGGVWREVYVNFVFLPTRNAKSQIDGIFVHAVDVTSLVKSRKRIEDSENQFRTLAESIPHLTWMADAAGHIFWYNRRWFDYTGTNLETMSGWGWQSVHDPAVLPDVVSRWRQALATGEPFEMIFPLKRHDGDFRPFLTRVEPIRDSRGNVVRWFGTNTDITDQRNTEEQLRRINRDLEEFSYVASHDLQAPLRTVNVFTQLLIKEAGGGNDRLHQYGQRVSEGVKRMITLIEDLLVFSRAIHSAEEEVGTADLSAAFTEALGVLKVPIEESSATITCSALPLVKGDTAQMEHVFENLLSNALKYRKAGVPPVIHVGARLEKEKWVVSVHDNGIGFDPQYAERIFGIFKRLHGKEYEGTGLGLAICKRIVERYHGGMWAESRAGEGSTFYFSALPVV